MSKPDKIQGEGDTQAARRFNEDAEAFVKARKLDLDEVRPQPAPKPGREQQKQLKEAERAGKARAKEKDPEETRDYQRAQK